MNRYAVLCLAVSIVFAFLGLYAQKSSMVVLAFLLAMAFLYFDREKK